MSKEKELQDAFANLLERDAVTFSATVLSVDKDKGFCKVKDDNLEYKARLASVINNDVDKFFLYPKVGSKVLISCIDEDLHQLYVDKCSEVEAFQFKIGKCEMSMDATGFNFKKENETLKGLLVELLSEIQKMVFTTNMGPTIKLVNAPKFEAIENKFKTLLKDS